MTNNLKIEVLVSNIPEDGSIASQFPSQEYVNQQLAKKANLSPEGRLDPSHAPDYTEIPGLYEHIEDTKDEIETSIADSLQDAKGYTNQQLSTGLQTKADLVNGKIPFDQIPFSADIEDQIQINVENITAVVDQKVAQVVEQVNGVATAANRYTDTKVAENKAYVDTTVGNVIEDVERLGVSKAVTIPTYLTPEAGVASGTGVAAGAYYNVRSTEDDTVLVEYQNVGGVPTPSGKSYPSSSDVQLIRNDVVELAANTVYFHLTVAAMVADETLTDGKVVATKGYRNIFDDGGAIYLISATATDYSIPLANGLHAVFRDSFDIRKFGVVSSPTLDQTIELSRMVAYADTRVYEIDFLNFSIITPKTWAWAATRGVLANTTTPINVNPSQVMGLNFNYCHKLKNLKITHDKTTRLNTSQSLINFLPLKNPSSEQWFELENVTFDPWVDNYQPRTENYLGAYDGMRHGLFCHPAVGSDIPQWSETATNISFRFKNVHFTSPAYSYNLTTSAIHARNIIADNLTGQYMGLYLNYMANNLICDTIKGVHRYDLIEAGRAMVHNLIHYEAELANRVGVFDLVDLNNISAIDSVTGLPASVFVYHNIGTTTIK